jgi:hypothetical protein
MRGEFGLKRRRASRCCVPYAVPNVGFSTESMDPIGIAPNVIGRPSDEV